MFSALASNKNLEPGDKLEPLAWKFHLAKPEAIPVHETKEGCTGDSKIPVSNHLILGRSVNWVVDYEGNQIPNKSELPRIPRADRPRNTPPARTDNYKGHIIDPRWDPIEDGDECSVTCREALDKVSMSQCKSLLTHPHI